MVFLTTSAFNLEPRSYYTTPKRPKAHVTTLFGEVALGLDQRRRMCRRSPSRYIKGIRYRFGSQGGFSQRFRDGFGQFANTIKSEHRPTPNAVTLAFGCPGRKVRTRHYVPTESLRRYESRLLLYLFHVLTVIKEKTIFMLFRWLGKIHNTVIFYCKIIFPGGTSVPSCPPPFHWVPSDNYTWTVYDTVYITLTYYITK